MNTGLTPSTEQAIINLGHTSDWYAYAQKTWGTEDESLHAKMNEKVKPFRETFWLPIKAVDTFAINSYIHRTFQHWGYLPGAQTDDWYDMLFLYLHLYRLPIPVEHRHALHVEWVRRPKGAAEAAAAEIRQILRRK